MQADLDQLVEWADKWQMQFNVSKCKVMHVGQKNTRSLYTMRNNGLQIVEVEKDLGVKISSDLKGVLQRTFFISTNERLMYKFYKTYNYFIFK